MGGMSQRTLHALTPTTRVEQALALHEQIQKSGSCIQNSVGCFGSMVLTFYPVENKHLICLAKVQLLESQLLTMLSW